MVIRKSAAKLSAAERAKLVLAIKALKNAPSQFNPRTNSRYDDYVYVHLQAMMEVQVTDRSKPVEDGNWTQGMMMRMWAHGGPAFLPWHRKFLYQFELDLQAAAGDPTLGIPYWDWTTDRDPQGAPWLNDLMGGNGDTTTEAVAGGPFAGATNWKISLSTDGVNFLKRSFANPILLKLPIAGDVTACRANPLYDADPWNISYQLASFRNQLEGAYIPGGVSKIGLHDRVHKWVGGVMDKIETSPNDPVFFLHHSQVDRIWAMWQHDHPDVPHYLPPTSPPRPALWDAMTFYDPNWSASPPWPNANTTTPANVLDYHTMMNYSYDDEAQW